MKAPWRKPPRAIVGSAVEQTGDNKQYTQRLRQPWQDRALTYYDLIGELNYCSRFYARMMSRVEFFAARMEPDGEIERLAPDTTPAQLLARVQDPGGGRKEIQYNYGRLKMITGEGVLLVTDEESDDERWRFLWRDEVKVEDNGVSIRKNAQGELTDERGTSYRMWSPHPRWSDLADSPFHSVLEIAEELVILTAAVRATAISRTVNGILVYPTEIAPLSDEDQNMDDDPERNPFMQKLIEHITAAIENPGSPEARVPFLWEGGYEYLDRVLHIALHDKNIDYMEKDMRMEAIDRLALSLDLPPEALKGLSDANHWSAQQVKWDMWQSHGVRIADDFAQDITAAYLRPALRQEKEDWRDIVIGYDDSKVVSSPDQTSSADEAWDRAQISDEGYMTLKGIPLRFKPSPEEKQFVFAMKTRNAELAGLDPGTPSARGPTTPPDVSTNGQALTPPQPTGGRVVSRQEARVATITGAAHMAIRQCRSKAGARLRARVLRPPAHGPGPCEDCTDITDVENAHVASALGMAGLEQLAQNDPLALIKGGTDDFRGILQEWGVHPADSEVLCQRLEAHAAKTLFDPNTPEVPMGFAAHVEHALEVAERAVVE